jgi:hydroxymethylbilane synthase
MATEPAATTTTTADPAAIAPRSSGSVSSASRPSYGLGTRQSPLALAQTSIVHSLLSTATAHRSPPPEFPIHAQTTAGDRNQVTALHQMDAKALWTTDLETALLAGDTDLVIHSLKDMPTQLPAGCSLGAALSRSERRDCVVMSPASAAKGYKTLADLPGGSVVGTSSVRRLAQLHAKYPQLKTQDVRGNIGTRLRKLDDENGPYAALILAATGLQRIGLSERVSSFLSRREGGWLGAVGQGAIGVEIRHGDVPTEKLCEGILEADGNGSRVHWECLAERMLLRTLEGGCSVPVAVETEWRRATASGDDQAEPDAVDDGPTQLLLFGLVASVDGARVVERSLTATVRSRDQAEEAGLELARRLIAGGAEDILKEITLNRKLIAEGGNA